MNIVVASDQRYVPHLETLLISIAENKNKNTSVNIYVLDGGINEQSRRYITQIGKKYKNMSFQFIRADECVLREKLGDCIKGDRSLSAYARILIPELIKDEDKACYLDVDAIVLSDLTDFYETDISQYAIAGVLDTNPIQRHYNVGLNGYDVYINSGVILWNIKKCREIHFVEKCMNFIAAHNGNVDAMDQGTINGVLGKGLIKVIHPKYNVITSFFQLNQNDIIKIYHLKKYYNDNEIKEATSNPVFVHFTPNMTTRPWVKHCKHPLKEKYWKYRKLTEYCEYTLQEDERKLKERILGWLFRNQTSLFIRVVSLAKERVK